MESSSYTDTSLYWQIPYITKEPTQKTLGIQNNLQKNIQILREAMNNSKKDAIKTLQQNFNINYGQSVETITQIRVSEDFSYFVLILNKTCIQIWPIGHLNPIAQLNLNYPLQSFEISLGSPQIFYLTSLDIRVWDFYTNEDTVLINNQVLKIKSFVLSKDSKYFVLVGPGGSVKVWDWKKSCVKVEFKTLIKFHYDLAISDDKHYLTICSEKTMDSGFELIIWDLKSQKQIGTSKGNGFLIKNLKITSNNKYIIGAIGDKKIAVWDLEQFISNESQGQRIDLVPKVIEKKIKIVNNIKKPLKPLSNYINCCNLVKDISSQNFFPSSARAVAKKENDDKFMLSFILAADNKSIAFENPSENHLVVLDLESNIQNTPNIIDHPTGHFSALNSEQSSNSLIFPSIYTFSYKLDYTSFSQSKHCNPGWMYSLYNLILLKNGYFFSLFSNNITQDYTFSLIDLNTLDYLGSFSTKDNQIINATSTINKNIIFVSCFDGRVYIWDVKRKYRVDIVVYKKTQIMLDCSLDDKYLITLDDEGNIEKCVLVYEIVKVGYDKVFLFRFKQSFQSAKTTKIGFICYNTDCRVGGKYENRECKNTCDGKYTVSSFGFNYKVIKLKYIVSHTIIQ
ncbi:hypothetical protein SteCoe_14362 [Stentor coeruleus]|uniref:Uncharacterized protein n=1 Tax=Stentor coeruleus TaxID=5963 RepID=A0A1R2C642_9CILI|nr:hypothetical protein SteCoe_14362 [Stentor coeruleus]